MPCCEGFDGLHWASNDGESLSCLVSTRTHGAFMSEPSYLLSLAVENIRCFGPRQELLTQNEDGSPAMWTVLLGENGVCKTHTCPVKSRSV